MSMVDGLIYVLENAIVRYTLLGQIPRPLGTKHPAITPFQALRTEDGWIVVAIGNDSLWTKFCNAIDHPQLAAEPRFRTNALRTDNQGELAQLLENITRTRNTEDWMATLEDSGLPCSPINTIDDVVRDPNVAHRNMIVEVDQPLVGPVRIVGSPFHLSETPAAVNCPAPLLGQHTEEVLAHTLGYSQDRIEELISDRVAFGMCDL
jgi:CoA:oxalate CoA-transferase